MRSAGRKHLDRRLHRPPDGIRDGTALHGIADQRRQVLRALGRDADGFEERTAAPLKGKAAPVRLYAPRRKRAR